MQYYLTSEYGLWIEPILVLAIGATMISGMAALAGRAATSAIWQRTFWQLAMVGLLALLAVELTGTGPAVVRLCETNGESTTTEAAAAAVLPALGATAGSSGSVYWENSLHAVGRRPTNDFPVLGDLVGGDSSRRLKQFSVSPSATGVASYREPASCFSASPGQAGSVHLEEFLLTAGQASSGTLIVETSSTQQAVTEPSEKPVSAKSTTAVWPAQSNCVWWPGIIWALGTVLIVGRIVCARLLLLVFRWRHGVVADDALHERVERLARRLAVRRPVCVLKAAGLKAPVAFGCLRPTVCLPASFTDEFDSREQEAMLAHELGHLAARDPAWQLVADFCCAALWWHPLAWWSRRRLRAACEASADEASLLVPDGPDLLAACLVAMGRRLARPRQLGWLSVEGLGFRSSLGRRVERLLNLPKRCRPAPRRGRIAAAWTVLPVSLVIVTILCTAWARPRACLAEGGTTMNVLTSSWRRSLAAVALVALVSPLSSDAVAGDDLSNPDRQLALVDGEDGERERGEGERREGERAEGERREGERREGERAEGERAEGERREGDRREGERREGDRREGDRREGEAREREEREHHEAEHRERREAEEREHAERTRHDEELRHEHDELEEHAARIERELRELGEGKPDAREELTHKLGEIRHRIEEIRGHFRGREEEQRREMREHQRHEVEAHAREIERRHQELEQRAHAIKRELAGLRDGEDEKAERLQHEMREIQQVAGQLEREMQEIRQRFQEHRGPTPQEREELGRRVEELKRKITELSEAGRHEEAEQLKRQGREMMQRFQERFARPDQPRHQPEGRRPEDMERRIGHVKVAIENLRAAGMHDAAERLAQEVERAIHGDRGHREGPPPDQRDRAFQELRGEVQQMRREMNEIREHLKRLLEHKDR